MDDRDRTLQHVREELERQAEGHKQRLEAVAGMTSPGGPRGADGPDGGRGQAPLHGEGRELEQLAREEEQQAHKIVTIAISGVASSRTAR